MNISRRNFTTQTQLPRRAHAATQHLMRGRISSLLVLIGLLFGIVVMPAMAHASSHEPAHATEILDVREIGEAEHSGSNGAEKDMPCHAATHHHCSIALQLDAPRISLSRLAKSPLVRPASTAPLRSQSHAPPLDPPNA